MQRQHPDTVFTPTTAPRWLSLVVGIAYVLVAALIALQLPDELFSPEAKTFILAIGAIAAWRYSWWSLHLVRGVIYQRRVFPRLRAEAEARAEHPDHIFVLVTSFRIPPEVTYRVYDSIIRNAAAYGVPTTIIASLSDRSDVEILELVLAELDMPERLSVRYMFQRGDGKRSAMAEVLRAVSRMMPTERSLIVFMDGDTQMGTGTLVKSMGFFRKYPDYGAHQAGYCVNAGLEWLLDWMQNAQVRDADIDYLRSQRDRELRQLLERLSGEFARQMAVLEEQIHGLAGHPFNIGSPKQLGEVLFAEMGLQGGKKSKGGAYSTDSSVLETLAAQGHDIAARVLDWRQLAKLKGTYTDALIDQINPRTGRVHTAFSLAATNTGRLSSNEPNLQNIPVRTEAGRQIRAAFIAEPGHLLLSVDYSQIELRLVAAMAGIEVLKQAFREGLDIHAMTAAQVFGVPLDQVTGEIRRRAKTINFGIIYGISAFGLAAQLGIPQAEAGQFIRTYLERFPELQAYMERTKAFCREHGHVRTLFGRKCHMPGIKDGNPARRGFAERLRTEWIAGIGRNYLLGRYGRLLSERQGELLRPVRHGRPRDRASCPGSAGCRSARARPARPRPAPPRAARRSRRARRTRSVRR